MKNPPNPKALERFMQKVLKTEAAINARKTHCKNGHELTIENTYQCATYKGKSRVCKICNREWERASGRNKRKKPKRTSKPIQDAII
jgi:hypothetical protein